MTQHFLTGNKNGHKSKSLQNSKIDLRLSTELGRLLSISCEKYFWYSFDKVGYIDIMMA